MALGLFSHHAPYCALRLPLGPEPRGSTAPFIQLLIPRLCFSAPILYELNIPTTTMSEMITFSPVPRRAGAQFFHWSCSVPPGRRRVSSLPAGPQARLVLPGAHQRQGKGTLVPGSTATTHTNHFFLPLLLPAEAEQPKHFMNS